MNGLRAVLKKGLPDFLESACADIVCFQETKAAPEQVDTLFFPPDGYHAYWNAAEKKGYSGTLVLSKKEPINVTYGFGKPEHDTEGRVINCEFDDFHLVNVYTPNSKDGLKRLDYRCNEWDVCFLEHLQKLEETKPVVTCGDFNVAHKEIDIARPKTNLRNPGFTVEERASFDKYVEAGFVDTFREFNKEPGQYSWWSMRMRARERNVGWRIDYFLVSQGLRPRLKDAFILQEVMGSDHCPVGIELE